MQTVLVLEPFVSFKNSPAPVSRAFGDSNWVLAQEQKAIFSEENRELKKKVGGSGCVTFCFPLSCFGRRSLVRSAFAAMGRREISLPSRLASLHAFLPPLAFLLFFFFASPYPSVISPRSPVAVSVVSRSQLERTSGRDEAAQVPGASMKSLQCRDD